MVFHLKKSRIHMEFYTYCQFRLYIQMVFHKKKLCTQTIKKNGVKTSYAVRLRWQKILQQKRHGQTRHWDPSKLTHFNASILTRIDRAILVKIPVLKCVNLLGSQRSVWTCHYVAEFFSRVTLIHTRVTRERYSLVTIANHATMTRVSELAIKYMHNICFVEYYDYDAI